MAGSGPLCPVDNRHGRTIYLSGGEVHCPHVAHGGNGMTWRSERDVENYQQTEEDVATIFETAARDVLAEKITLDAAVASIAKQTKRSSAQVREQVKIAMETVQGAQAAKAAERERASAKSAERKADEAKKATRKAASGKSGEHVPGQVVRDALKDLGLGNKDLAAAGGFSLSRVAEITKVGDNPPSWNGRDRHATTEQWATILPALQAMAKKAAPKGKAAKKSA